MINNKFPPKFAVSPTKQFPPQCLYFGAEVNDCSRVYSLSSFVSRKAYERGAVSIRWKLVRKVERDKKESLPRSLYQPLWKKKPSFPPFLPCFLPCWPSLNLSSAYEEKSHRGTKSAAWRTLILLNCARLYRAPSTI